MSDFDLKEASYREPSATENHNQEIARLNKRLTQLEKRITIIEGKKARPIEKPEMSKAAQEMVETLFSRLSPMDVVGCNLTRIGRAFDGGYIMAPLRPDEKVAYSLGINRDVSWDLEMARNGCKVYQYDHTIDGLPHNHEGFNYFKKGITTSHQTNQQMTCLRHELVKNGHKNTNDILLKMDIEGDEWGVFADLEINELQKFSQILVEFHDLHKVYKLFWYRTALEGLNKLFKTHQAVHVHGNNNTSLRIIGGYAVPPVLEVTFLRRDLFQFSPCTRTFPNELDQPNNPSFAEHQLGSFQFTKPN
ncbi:FkbM family methyltransferase [Pseudovibrio brasiliensis]|uniref:FkbM family methyltransferase n=1 Tax=Pseudovibrio brasiliensis TaxID=1898042 RepID=A0ABX8AH57_9HYPH|nr:FkbM family methyltransferase [Pseudovibrio brasiliensis]QUS54408.1 FkbM family methyltransferase [Pseudovibrio brasiliensis]